MNQKASGIRAATRIHLAAFPASLAALVSSVRLQALNVLRGLAEIRLGHCVSGVRIGQKNGINHCLGSAPVKKARFRRIEAVTASTFTV